MSASFCELQRVALGYHLCRWPIKLQGVMATYPSGEYRSTPDANLYVPTAVSLSPSSQSQVTADGEYWQRFSIQWHNVFGLHTRRAAEGSSWTWSLEHLGEPEPHSRSHAGTRHHCP